MAKRIADFAAFGAFAFLAAGPALAGAVVETPVPLAGVGVGALAVLGLGYRALRSRIDN